MYDLTKSGIERAKEDGIDRACFGRGLWLDMRGTQPRWLYRYTSPVTRKEREYSLGPEDRFMTLAALKAAHDRLIGEVAGGHCPTERRQRERATQVQPARTLFTADGMTLHTALKRLIEQRRSGWRSPKSEAQWWQTFEAHVLPKYGSMPVAALEPEHVADMLTGGRNPWLRTPVTGERLQARIQAVIDHADSLERRQRLNPADMRVLAHHLPRQPRRLASRPACSRHST
jgi:hypothetical protein